MIRYISIQIYLNTHQAHSIRLNYPSCIQIAYIITPYIHNFVLLLEFRIKFNKILYIFQFFWILNFNTKGE